MAENHHTTNGATNRPPDAEQNNGAASSLGAKAARPPKDKQGHTNGYPDAQTNAIWLGELSEEHRHALEVESAISPEAIEARGYFTTNDTNVLRLHGFSKAQSLIPALVMPMWNSEGERVGVTIRQTIPRIDKNGKSVKYDVPPGSPVTLDISPVTRELLSDLSKPLFITEGAKKADSIASKGFPALNLNGVWAFLLKGVPLPEWETLRPSLRDRLVIIAYDSDVSRKRAVETALRRLEALLKHFGARIKVIYFKDGPKGEKTGLDDFFARGGTVEQILALARDLETREESSRKRKEKEKADKRAQVEAEATEAGAVVIETNNRQQQDELTDLSRAIERYNAQRPRLFHGAAGLVRIDHTPEGTPVIKHATREAVQSIAGKAARWISTNENEVRDVAPPRDLCAIFLASPDDWRGIPIIEGTATAPFFAPDGTLCATSGYHPSARMWLSLPKGFDVGDTQPTPENIQESKRIILEDILGEVSFGDDASRAHAIAQMFLPFVRRLIEGPTPLHLWNAPLRGSGKSYAAELCILPFAEPTPTPEKSNTEEWRKSLLCDLITGPSHIYLDNIKGSLHSPALDAAITNGYFKDRLTGTGEMVTAPVRCVWVATANNAELTEDAVTRAVVISIDPESENPDTREFRSDPKAFIRANRGKVCGAILTLIRAWQTAGCPNYSGANRCRFPNWAHIIGGILDIAEIPGFLDNLEEARENISRDGDAIWPDFFADWGHEFGEAVVTVKQLLPIASKIEGFDSFLTADTDPKKVQQLAKAVRQKRNRRFGSWKLKSAPKVQRQVAYQLIKADDAQKVHGSHSSHGSASKARNPQRNQEKKEENGFSEESDYFRAHSEEPCEPYEPCTVGASDNEELI